jgi:purine-binding chemotaxis protein CheW
MSEKETGLAQRMAALRLPFDQSFAVAPETAEETSENLLLIRVAGNLFALRVSEIAGLFADKPITPLPTGASSFVGLAGFRGAIIPVFALATLLGCAEKGALRWLVLAGRKERVGLAFDRFEAHLEAHAGAISVSAAGAQEPGHVKEIVRTAQGVVPLISIASVLEAIKARVDHSNSKREQ